MKKKKFLAYRPEFTLDRIGFEPGTFQFHTSIYLTT